MKLKSHPTISLIIECSQTELENISKNVTLLLKENAQRSWLLADGSWILVLIDSEIESEPNQINHSYAS